MLFLNGRAIADNAPELALYTSAFKSGDGLFETIRIYRGKPLFLAEHFKRLFAAMYFFNYKFEEEVFQNALTSSIFQLIIAENLHHARVRLQVFRVDGTLDRKAQYILEGISLLDDYYSTSRLFALTEFRLIPIQFSPISGFKLSNRLHYDLAIRYANENYFDDALLFSEGYAVESAIANLFIIKDQKCITPPLNSGCLNGIMRKIIISMCKELRVPLSEKKISEKDLYKADEIFLTNTIRGVIPVKRYNDIEWVNDTLPMVSFLRKSFKQWIDTK
jgi:branched-chain amino acid aminotransferase